MDYTSRLLQRLKELEVHTIVETCGHFDMDEFEENILPYLDAIYFDLKIYNPDGHKKQCGIPNQVILDNFTTLFQAYHDGGTPLIARIPLIPGITATDGNLAALAGFLRGNEVREVALLQYNPLWIEKSKKIGRDNPLAGREVMTSFMKPSEIARCHTIFESFDII